MALSAASIIPVSKARGRVQEFVMMDENKPMSNPELLVVLLQKGRKPLSAPLWRRDNIENDLHPARETRPFTGIR